MKLGDAIHKMNPGDKFNAPALTTLTPYTMQDDGSLKNRLYEHPVSASPDNLNLEGEIIRAEPEVLTADDVCIKLGFSPDAHRFLQLVMIASEADKNGQIKEYKRLKPLIDAALNEEMNATHELRNLTPPWEPEK